MTIKLIALVLCFFLNLPACWAKDVHHYVFFNMERERINESSFLETKAFEGAQLKYTWKELEPEKDKYDFSAIEKDLAFLNSKGKKLFIQLQDVTFDPASIFVPQYLRDDKEYHGGVAQQYNDAGTVGEGWVARRWDPAVQERFHKLLYALGEKFDGKIEGINLPETAITFGDKGEKNPPGFTPEIYKDAVIKNMEILKKAFPKSVTIQYANFMPGEFLPWEDHGYLREIYQAAKEAKIGVGGPDLLPYKKGQMNNGYHFMNEAGDTVPIGIAVQDGNYAYINPKTNKKITLQELIDFATNQLKADYIFWCTEEPYYSKDLIPFLTKSN